jgi:hypothetical protein
VSAIGDASNVDNIAAGDSIPEWRLVPNDNNIGQRNVAPVPGGGTSGLLEEFERLSFLVKNPQSERAKIQLEAALPPLLAERNWQLVFTSAGGAAFALAPGESREVTMRLTKGAAFSRADVEATAQRTIQLVGGMSYALDPTLTHPAGKGPKGNPEPGSPGHQHDDHCGCEGDRRLDAMGDALLRALNRRKQRVRDVEIRRVVVDIELEDCDD